MSAFILFREPYILFPVICPESQLPLSSDRVEILKQLEEKKLELSQMQDQIKEENRRREKYTRKLAKKLEYKKQIEELGSPPGMCSSNMYISSATP